MRIIFIPPEDSFEYQIQGIKCFMFRSFRWISGVLGFKMIILKLNKLNSNQSALWANSWIDTWFFRLCLMLSGLGNFVVDCHI